METTRLASSTPITATAGPTQADLDRIARRAYEIWEHAGRPPGQAEQHWVQAEKEIMAKSPLAPASFAEAEKAAREAYATSGTEKEKVKTSEQKNHWLEAEAAMRQQEKPARSVKPIPAPPPHPPIEPVQGNRPARKP